jgi:hypothetical protein
VLVASTLNSLFEEVYSTRWMATVSATAARVTVSVAVLVTPPCAADRVTEVLAVTDLVVTVNVALEAPAGTVTLAGTVATAVLLLESATTAPPDGAAPLSVTVASEVLPPVTLVGLRTSEESVTPLACGVTVSAAPLVTPA